MDLKTFIADYGVKKLADEMGTTTSAAYISQIAHGHRTPSAEIATQIEQTTKGVVMRWDLRPNDWHRIWPELTTRPDRPAMPDSQSAA